MFEPVFSDSRNIDSFDGFVSAVIMTESKWTVNELSRGISRPNEGAKSDRAYRYFLNRADWSATDLAQDHADYAFDQLNVGADDEVLLHVDDTHIGKTGDATDGVAELYNPVAGETELGNKFVTSCLQVGDAYLPYLAQMYIKEELAPKSSTFMVVAVSVPVPNRLWQSPHSIKRGIPAARVEPRSISSR
jgi:SRSO17 transposase